MPPIEKYRVKNQIEKLTQSRCFGGIKDPLTSYLETHNRGFLAVQEAGWCEYLSQMQFDALNRGWYHNYQGEFPSIHSLSLDGTAPVMGALRDVLVKGTN